MVGANLPLIQSYRPRTFRERGVSVHFTTPILAGARLRRGGAGAICLSERPLIGHGRAGQNAAEQLRAGALEVLVPNPAGGRGVYLLPWAEVSALCRPTMHDVILGQTIDASDSDPARPLSPLTLRAAARQVAALGLAGRPAAHSASLAMQKQANRLTGTRFTLLMEAILQTETGTMIGPQLEQEIPSEIERRGAIAMMRFATELGQPVKRIAETMDFLAELYAEIGIGFGTGEAANARLMAAMATLRGDLLKQGPSSQNESPKPVLEDNAYTSRHAMDIASNAELTARMASVPLVEARGRLSSLVPLMQDAIAAPADVMERFMRPGWLLDGWERICLLWQSAPSGPGRSEALHEIARELPILPDEAEVWLGLPPGTALQLLRRHALPSVSSRNERAPHDLVARNEHLRSMAS